tara:strand:- start:1522 stop:2103 length:582 start_codon:yes stop_codon:yes gene_type:complete
MKYQIRGLIVENGKYANFIKKYMEWYNTCRHLKNIDHSFFKESSPKKHVKEIFKLIASDGVYMYRDDDKRLMRYSVNFDMVRETQRQKTNKKNKRNERNERNEEDDIFLNEDFSLFRDNYYQEQYMEIAESIPHEHKIVKSREEKFFNVLLPNINVIFEFENNLLHNIMIDTKEDINNELMQKDLLRIIALFR